MSALAIILARGQSKGLPGKNTADIAGKPCIAWTIEHAQRSAGIARVVVSSDDERALGIARAMEAETVQRPTDLATDTARVDDAARHAYTTLGEPDGPVVILYANAPVRPADLSERAIDTLVRTGCDSVQSYCRVGKHHPWWTARLGDDAAVRPWEGDVLNHGVFRRQDLPKAYIPDGGVIAVTPDALMLRLGVADGPHAFFGRDRRGVETGEGEVVDIDTRVDLLVADAVLRESVVEPRASGSGWIDAPPEPNRDRQGAGGPGARPGAPMAYLVSFRTYGSWIPGDARGTVDRAHNRVGTPTAPRNDTRAASAKERMPTPEVTLDTTQRESVDAAIRRVCAHSGWRLLALNVRSNHVHCVVTSDTTPERTMTAFKSWATRGLDEAGRRPDGRVWARHGSTRWLWD